MTTNLIAVEIADGVALVTLNNPPMNLVTLELTRELNLKLDGLASDNSVRALVLSGANPDARAFCAGSDVKEFPDRTYGEQPVSRNGYRYARYRQGSYTAQGFC